MNFSSNELAAWIQAIGSIIAVFIAMWIPYKTNKSLILDQKLKIELRRKNTLLLLLPILYLIRRTVHEFLEENNPEARGLFDNEIEEFHSNYFELIPHFSNKLQSLIDSDFEHPLLTNLCFVLFQAEEHLNENSYLQRRGYHAAWINHKDLFIEEASTILNLIEELILSIESDNSLKIS